MFSSQLSCRQVIVLFASFLVSALLLSGAQAASTQNPEPTAQAIIEAMEQNFEMPAGARRAHARPGSCFVGEFIGHPDAQPYSRSALFSGQAIPVRGRFSIAGSNAMVPDTARAPRGMGLQFTLPGGALHNMAMINFPVFNAATPQTFLNRLLATRVDPATGKPDPEKIAAFKATHPDIEPFDRYMAAHNPPPGFTQTPYYSVHTFHLIDDAGQITPVRWHFEPADGVHELSDEELAQAGSSFLEQALIERLQSGPAEWKMIVTLGQPGDTEDNPTQQWQGEHEQFEAGTLRITAAQRAAEGACDLINFDPMVLADGIQASSDPVLRMRSQAYALSFAHRLQER